MTSINTPNQLGKVLQGYRKLNGFTQKNTGEKVGLLPKTISSLELTPQKSTIGSLFKLLSALELEIIITERSSHSTPQSDW